MFPRKKKFIKNQSLRDFARYSFLNVCGMIGLSCYILADTYFISKGLGTNGLAALNLAIPIYSFIHGSGLMIGMGGGTRYTILKWQSRKEEADQVFTNAAVLTVIFAVIFFFTGLLFADQITALLGADEAVFKMSRTYLQVLMLFAPVFLLNNLLLCFVRNDGAPQLSMTAMLVGSISNVVLDYIFIFPLKMGIFGAVFATGLAPVISVAILSVFFVKQRNCFHLCRCRLSFWQLRGIVAGGLPSLIAEVASGMVILIFNCIILKIQGNIGVAAYGVIANLSLVVMAVYTGIAQGIQPLLSKNHAQGEGGEIKAVFRYALVTLFILSASIYLGIFFGAQQIAGVFNSEGNSLLQETAVAGLRIYFTACIFAGFNIILAVFFTSTENPLLANIISLLRGFIVIVPMAFLLAAIGKMTGIWCAFPATELIVSLFGAAMLIKNKKTIAQNVMVYKQKEKLPEDKIL